MRLDPCFITMYKIIFQKDNFFFCACSLHFRAYRFTVFVQNTWAKSELLTLVTFFSPHTQQIVRCAPEAAIIVSFSTTNEITTRIKKFPLPLHIMFFPLILFDFFPFLLAENTKPEHKLSISLSTLSKVVIIPPSSQIRNLYFKELCDSDLEIELIACL